MRSQCQKAGPQRAGKTRAPLAKLPSFTPSGMEHRTRAQLACLQDSTPCSQHPDPGVRLSQTNPPLAATSFVMPALTSNPQRSAGHRTGAGPPCPVLINPKLISQHNGLFTHSSQPPTLPFYEARGRRIAPSIVPRSRGGLAARALSDYNCLIRQYLHTRSLHGPNAQRDGTDNADQD